MLLEHLDDLEHRLESMLSHWKIIHDALTAALKEVDDIRSRVERAPRAPAHVGNDKAVNSQLPPNLMSHEGKLQNQKSP